MYRFPCKLYEMEMYDVAEKILDNFINGMKSFLEGGGKLTKIEAMVISGELYKLGLYLHGERTGGRDILFAKLRLAGDIIRRYKDKGGI